ncbi:S8 family peptidase [Psychrobacillus sp. FSL K6-1464]|uniref:S8 family peptidase n=1 Tax=Psychrobacillus sp. FSL K6-1464 TaxID=2921545 RepID=UPI0030F91663
MVGRKLGFKKTDLLWKKRMGALVLSGVLLGSLVAQPGEISASSIETKELSKEIKLTGNLGDGKVTNNANLTLKTDLTGKTFEALVMYKNLKGKQLALKLGTKVQDNSLEDLGILVIQVDEKKFVELSKSNDILYVEKSITANVATATPDLSSIGEVIDLDNGEQASWGHQYAGIVNAHKKGYTGKGVNIAILDSGIAPHEELTVSGGVSFVDYTNSYSDDNGHGTHVAGIVGAKNNGKGIIGVAPDASIYAVKVMSADGKGDVLNFIKGINWAIENDMDIVNMSIGTTYNSPILQMVVKKAMDAGVTVVAAAGNNGSNQRENLLYPGNYPESITVSSVGQTGKISEFSSNGANVDFAAPGERIVSTAKNGTYEGRSGTSMATPYVTGMVAILKESEKYTKPAQFELRLRMGIVDLGAKGKDNLYGYGLANLTSFYPLVPSKEVIPPVVITPPVGNEINPKDLDNAKKMVDYTVKYKSTYYLGRAQSALLNMPASGQKDELLTMMHQANFMLDTPLSNGNGGTPVAPAPTQPEPTNPTPTEPIITDPKPTPTEPEVKEPIISPAVINIVEKWLGYAEKYKSTYYFNKAQSSIQELPDSKVKRAFQARLDAVVIK